MIDPQQEPYERLFQFASGFIHVQRLADDYDYDTDYTIFDSEFNDLDGGILCDDYSHTLKEIAAELVGTFELTEVNIEDYRAIYDF